MIFATGRTYPRPPLGSDLRLMLMAALASGIKMEVGKKHPSTLIQTEHLGFFGLTLINIMPSKLQIMLYPLILGMTLL